MGQSYDEKALIYFYTNRPATPTMMTKTNLKGPREIGFIEIIPTIKTRNNLNLSFKVRSKTHKFYGRQKEVK